MNARNLRYMALMLVGLSLFGCTQDSRPEVVVYVAVDRKDAEPILVAFEQRTGIRVRAVYDAEATKTTGLVSRLVAEAARPRCDLFWNNEFVQTIQLAERGLLEPYRAARADAIPASYQDAAGLWYAQAARARVLVYNTRLVAEAEAPRTLRDLADAKWHGKVAVANPEFGTTRTHVAALFAHLGPPVAQELLQALLDNQARVVAGNAIVKDLVARADPAASPILVGLTDTDDVLAGQADGQPISMVYPDQEGMGTLIVPTTVCLLHGAPHPEQGRVLLDYLLSDQALQQLTAEGTGYHTIYGPVASKLSEVRALPVSYAEIHAQLEASSQWTARQFRQ